MLSEQWKAIPVSRRVVYFGLAGASAIGLLQGMFFVLLLKTGLFDEVVKWWGKDIVIDGFPYARILLSLVLSALVVLGTLGGTLWRQTRSLTVTVLVPVLALVLVLTIDMGCGYGLNDLVFSIKQTAEWYHKLTS
jgi:hypothetical protein